MWAFNLNHKLLEGKELAFYWSSPWYSVYVAGTQQMLSEWWIGKWIYFQCFGAESYRYQRQTLGLRTRDKRLKVRKLDTGGKAETNTGEDEEREWHVQRTLWNPVRGQHERTDAKNKNSLATRNDHLGNLLWSQLWQAGCKPDKRKTSAHHLCWRKQKRQALSLSLYLQCRVWHYSLLRTCSTFLFHYFFIFKNRLKFINLGISIFLSDCILPSVLSPISHTQNPFLLPFAKYNSKNQGPFVRPRGVFSLVWVQHFSEILLTAEEAFWNVMLWGFQKATSIWYMWICQ